MDGPSPVLLLLLVVGGEEDDTVVVVTDAEDGCGGLMGRIDADMMLWGGVVQLRTGNDRKSSEMVQIQGEQTCEEECGEDKQVID